MIQEGDLHAERALGLVHLFRKGSDPNAPLAVLVHGRAGNRTVMLAFRRAVPDTCHVLAVEAPYDDPVGGKSWWLIDDPQPLQACDRSLDQLLHAIRAARSHYQVTPRTTVGIGFSQGAGLLSLAIQQPHHPFSAVALLAGFVMERAPLTQALPHPVDVLVAHGSNDTTVPFSDAERGINYLRQRGATVEMAKDDVGHKIGTSGMRALARWATLHLSDK